ncbi:MAG: metallophosphoesterase, partial [Bacilli bacterium]
AITINQDVLLGFDDTINEWVTKSVGVPTNYLNERGEVQVALRSGNKLTPFPGTPEENRDDYFARNVRLVLSDGTVLYSAEEKDPTKQLNMGDSAGASVEKIFTFTVPQAAFDGTEVTIDTRLLPDGAHRFEAQVNTDKVVRTLYVDNSAPTISANVADGEMKKGQFSLNAQITDAGSGIAEQSATLNGERISLPYETSSVTLAPGPHTLVINAKDKVGNTATQTITFTTPKELPENYSVLSPVDGTVGLTSKPELKVTVKDPEDEPLTVHFYKGMKYTPKDSEVRTFIGSAPIEPPSGVVGQDERAISLDEKEAMSKVDGKTVVTDSETAFPYHRFEVTVGQKVLPTDEIELQWTGKSLAGRKVSAYAWNLTTERWILLQSKVAGDTTLTLNDTVVAKDFVKDNKVQLLVQDEIVPSVPKYDYSMLWYSDTQYYSKSYPQIYSSIVDWTLQNKDALNVKYIFHTGDLVDNFDDTKQWNVADKEMKKLDDAKIPYGVLAGNHDVNHKAEDYSFYGQYFGADRFQNKPYYGESYKNNRGHYDLFSVNGVDYISVYMGWGIYEEEIAWMNSILKQYPNRKAFLNFHEYLLVTGNRSPIAERIFQDVIVPNKNVLFVLSGHYHDAETLVSPVDDNGDGQPDRNVVQMLADYQMGPEGGSGYIRMFLFDGANNRMMVRTFSPYKNDWNYYDKEQWGNKDEFDVRIDLAPVKKRVETDAVTISLFTKEKIGTAKNSNANMAMVIYNSVASNKRYGWYTIVNDTNGAAVRYPVAMFTTGQLQDDSDSSSGAGSNGGSNPGTGGGAGGNPSTGGNGSAGSGSDGSSQNQMKWFAVKRTFGVGSYSEDQVAGKFSLYSE